MSEPSVALSVPAPVANVVATKIVRVTVYEDRAEVIREGEVLLAPGSAVLVVSGLPAVLSDEHVIARLEALADVPEGRKVTAHVNDLRVDRRVVGGDDALAARRAVRQREIDALDEELREAQADLERADENIDAAHTALRCWAQDGALATARGHVNADAWQSGLAAFEQDLAALVAQRASARAALAQAQRRRHGATEVPSGTPPPTGQQTFAELTLRVSVDAGSAEAGPVRMKLVVSTVVPCAAWRPTHEAWLLERSGPSPEASGAGAAAVRFTTFAAIWNRTGEAWAGVELVLSTARPSAGAELPSLHADRLTLRPKSAEEKRTIVVEHRHESVPRSSLAGAPQGVAPGVDDGGQARTFRVQNFTVPDDGRPHRVEIASFQAPCTTARVAYPELVPQVFLRATLDNPGPAPILAGAVALVITGGAAGEGAVWVGTGDVLYVGANESFDLSFGSDDRFLVRTKKRRVEDKKLVGKDVVHFLREAVLSQTGTTTERVLVHLRLPVSELKQLRVLNSPQHGSDDVQPDEHGIVRIPVDLAPGVERKVVLAFSLDTSGDVRIPDPW